jgi:hypothetical protein
LRELVELLQGFNVANTLKNEGKEQSYSSRPFKILILEKRFQGNLEISLF